MSLRKFVATHRDELIKRTRAKVALRSTPQPNANELEHGVPIFLSQLAKVLGDETAHAPIDDAITRTAALHGEDLQKYGFTIEQVVHDYGDICQSVTELALELNAPFTTAEFQTLNLCLDNAIAGAVTAWSSAARERPRGHGPSDSLAHDLRSVLDAAIGAYEAIHSGHVGAGGATSVLLGRSLLKMRALLMQPKKAN